MVHLFNHAVDELPLAKVDEIINFVRITVFHEGQIRKIDATALTPTNSTYERLVAEGKGSEGIQIRNTGWCGAVEDIAVVAE